MAEYTKGPWYSKPSIHGSNYKYVQVGEDEMYTTLEMKPADADIAAAAPEMHEALKAHLVPSAHYLQCKACNGDNKCNRYWDLVNNADLMTIKAIQKAEGRQNDEC